MWPLKHLMNPCGRRAPPSTREVLLWKLGRHAGQTLLGLHRFAPCLKRCPIRLDRDLRQPVRRTPLQRHGAAGAPGAALLGVLCLVAASSAVAQQKHVIDPMLPGSLDPRPLPPLKNPDAPSIPAKELFARRSTPFPGPPRSIGGDFNGCLAGAESLPITGPAWQVMRPSRNRNWGNPELIRFIERLSANAKKL